MMSCLHLGWSDEVAKALIEAVASVLMIAMLCGFCAFGVYNLIQDGEPK